MLSYFRLLSYSFSASQLCSYPVTKSLSFSVHLTLLNISQSHHIIVSKASFSESTYTNNRPTSPIAVTTRPIVFQYLRNVSATSRNTSVHVRVYFPDQNPHVLVTNKLLRLRH